MSVQKKKKKSMEHKGRRTWEKKTKKKKKSYKTENNKMAILNLSLSVITSDVNGLNFPMIRHKANTWI